MEISAILVNYNGLALSRVAIDSLLRFSPGIEIIVVDNGSDDGSAQSIGREFPSVQVLALGENKGFGFANNVGAQHAKGNFLFFLNNDTILTEDTPQALSNSIKTGNRVGACGPKLLNADGSFQLSTGYDTSLINEWRTRRLQRRVKLNKAVEGGLHRVSNDRVEVDWVTGAALMVRKDVFQRVGGFDEKYFMYFEDADLCRQIRHAGWNVLYDPSSAITHLKGSSGDSAKGKVGLEYRKSQIHYYHKHGSLISNLLLRAYLLAKFGLRWIRLSLSYNAQEDKAHVVSLLRLLIA